jgi:hypothetical protein
MDLTGAFDLDVSPVESELDSRHVRNLPGKLVALAVLDRHRRDNSILPPVHGVDFPVRAAPTAGARGDKRPDQAALAPASPTR